MFNIEILSEEAKARRDLELQSLQMEAANKRLSTLSQQVGPEAFAQIAQSDDARGAQVRKDTQLAMWGNTNTPLPSTRHETSLDVPVEAPSIVEDQFGSPTGFTTPATSQYRSVRDVPMVWQDPRKQFATELTQRVGSPNFGQEAYALGAQYGMYNSKDGHMALPNEAIVVGPSKVVENMAQARNAGAMADLHDTQRTALIPAQVRNYQASAGMHNAQAGASNALARQRQFMEVSPGSSVYGLGGMSAGGGTGAADSAGGPPTPIVTAPDRPNARWSSPQSGIDPATGNPIVYQVGPEGAPRVVPGIMPKPQTGLQVEFGADGRPVSITTGGTGGKQGPGGMSTTTVGRVEKDILDANESLARADGIAKRYQDSYQQIGPKLGFSTAAAKDKLGVNLSPQDKKSLGEYTQARAQAFELLNTELNRLSGAAVTEHEMDRLKQSLPTPGNGIFDGDSPVEFNAKTTRLRETLALAKARLALVRKGGIKSIEQMPLSSMDQVIKSRGDALEADMRRKNPGASKQEVESMVREQLRQEYDF